MKPLRTPSAYVETSTWNFYFADDIPAERKEITRIFFEHIRQGRHEAFISRVVLEEFQQAPEPRRGDLFGLMSDISPTMLQVDPGVMALASEYVARGVIPASNFNDALHIAVALMNNIRLLVSWNFKHIVKPKTRRMVSALSREMGYNEIDIASPEEVIYDVP